MGKLLSGAAEHLRQKHRRAIWMRVVIGLACIVVFCTTYALILPAVTLENAACGLEEHVHTDACYTQATSNEGKKLICSLEALGIHTHSSSCFDSEGNVLCGYADFVVHTHDESCYDQNGTLICPLPEVKEHIHTDACYSEVQEVIREKGHTHTEDCYTTEQGELNCPLEESEGHTHGEDCYTTGQDELICPLEESGEHTHGEGCYAAGQKELSCQLEESEGHTHGEACYEQKQVLVCGQEEQPDQIEKTEPELICGQEEIQLHTHTSECYTNDVLTCGRQEIREHVHTEDCFEVSDTKSDDGRILTCGMQEHTHNENCFQKAESSETEEDGILLASESDTEPVRLMEYAKTIPNGQVDIIVSKDDVVLSPEADGTYEVFAGETYNVRVAYSGDKIDSGRYFVTFTSSSNIDLTQTGSLILYANDQTSEDVGDWYFLKKEDGTVLLIFDINDNITNYSKIVLFANVTCEFDYSDTPVNFDGIITVKVKYNEDTPATEVNKWASSTQPDDSKIRWRTEIYGNSKSEIIGNTLTDTLTTENHYYTDEDMEEGIEFEATRYEGNFDTGKKVETHTWTVKKGDVGLDWTESGWSYGMPQKVWCTTCKEEVTLGDDNWLYYLRYTSTREAGGSNYENKVAIDGVEDTGTLKVTTSGSDGQIVKTVEYQSQGTADRNDDSIEWTITATIPGAGGTGKYDYYWHLWDSMSVILAKRTDPYVNNIDLATVTAKINGQTITVPEISEATANDPICWENGYSSDKGNITCNREIDLYNQCICTEQTCSRWKDNKCEDKNEKGFCQCWHYTDDVELTFTYRTAAGSLIEQYGNESAQLSNSVQLNNVQYFPEAENKWQSVNIDSSKAQIPLPGVITKQLTDEPEEGNGYIAEYTITVNEAMADMSDFQELTIRDTMTTTLKYQPNSLKIYAKDADGDEWEVPSAQYTVAYEENVEDSKNQTAGNQMTITLKKEALGAYKYTLVYDTRVTGGSGNYTYNNTASITISGQDYEVSGGARNVPDAVIQGNRYGATLYKYDSEDINKPLDGAEFGLYIVNIVNEENDTGTDQLIAVYTTGAGQEGKSVPGVVQVKTDTSSGIILSTHVLYYLKELKAPEGYELDETKHYFWFCDNEDTITCSYSEQYGLEPYNATCVYTFTTTDEKHDLEISNKQIQDEYKLPETGGSGTALFTTGGFAMITGCLIIGYRMRRKRERRLE